MDVEARKGRLPEGMMPAADAPAADRRIARLVGTPAGTCR